MQLQQRECLQAFIDKVVIGFYMKPASDRHVISLLKMINECQKKLKKGAFSSTKTYIELLAITTDYLLDNMLNNTNEEQINEAQNRLEKTYVDPHDALIIHVDELSKELSIKKIEVDYRKDSLNNQLERIGVNCVRRFGKLPDRIEIIHLMSQSKQVYQPYKHSPSCASSSRITQTFLYNIN